MGFDKRIRNWAKEPPYLGTAAELIGFLTDHGFVFYSKTKHGVMYQHPKLVGKMEYPNGCFMFREHVKGKQGQVYGSWYADAAKIVQIIKDEEKREKQQQESKGKRRPERK